MPTLEIRSKPCRARLNLKPKHPKPSSSAHHHPTLTQETYYSIGGGFVVTADELQGGGSGASRGTMSQGAYPFPFPTAAEVRVGEGVCALSSPQQHR